ncbi:alpha/beta hydrolase fold domain-containing protein [Candidatus Bathyarchaeota archaeon]|nr:alpha/beta hydrolase fold domain-containing protein [Candidatus Bathyarchaeota archaeon]
MPSAFRYLQLKLIVVLLRLLNSLSTRALRREPLPPGTTRERVRIPTRDPGRFLEGFLYSPPTEATQPPTHRYPVLINWHGSGFVFPNFDTDKAFCAFVARKAGICVLDADYRKGPESPFPGPVNDAEDAMRWVGTQSHRFDTKRVAVSGASAGGLLSLVASSSLRQALPELAVKIGIALYPGTDVTIDPATKFAPKPNGKVIPPAIARLFNECFAPDLAMRSDPRASPALADSDAFPDNLVILTCDGDNLAPEADALAEKLNDGNRRVTHRVLEGVGHGFDKIQCEEGTHQWRQRDLAYSLIVDEIVGAFASP